MKNVCVVTTTRADYGALKNTMRAIDNDDNLNLITVVTGTHLMESYGKTVNEIVDDGFDIDHTIDIDFTSKSTKDISLIVGQLSIKFAELYADIKPDLLLVLGDRFELIPICFCAVNENIPIAHISGGEVTAGAIDDCVRHCVTKMSYIHFPGCEEYRKRIIQLGENPERVYNFGDVGVENIYKEEVLTKQELEESIGIQLDKPYYSVTFHPVTLEYLHIEEQMEQLLKAIHTFPEFDFIITKANADIGGSIINDMIDNFVKTNDNCYAFSSLGIRRYLSLLKYSSGIIGNSSSGIIEAPCFDIPTINIGNRQKGRLQAESIINCEPTTEEIVSAIKLSYTDEFKKKLHNVENPYGKGDTSANIVKTINHYLENEKIDLKKGFYDINF